MKKAFLVLLTVILLTVLCSCAKKPISSSDELDLIGTWKIVSMDSGNDSNALLGALASVLQPNLSVGTEIVFNEDNTATVGGKPVTYKLNGDELTLTWDGSINFLLKISGEGDSLSLNYNNIVKAQLERE